LNAANQLLDEQSREDQKGLALGVPNKKPADHKQKSQHSSEFNDNYDEDFEEIEEDLPVDEIHPEDIQIQGIGASGQGITVSQSLGVDPSVDSLALEDYDHVEPVERLM